MKPLQPNEVEGLSVTVMGLGRFGGGLGVTRWLLDQGASVLLTDQASAEDLAEPLEQLRPTIDAGSLELRLGEHRVSDFTTPDLIVVNPAVPTPWENRFIRSAQAAGIRLTTEIELTIGALPLGARIAGITGSAGKSTTSALLAAGLSASGNTVLFGGNIGGSLLQQIDPEARDLQVVLELSSAMLYWLRDLDPFLTTGVLTGFAPNHLDWHGDLEHYRASKQRLLDLITPGGHAVLAPPVADWPVPPHADVAKLLDAPTPLTLLGDHNRSNASLARTAAATLGVDSPDSLEAMRAYRGLPHRLEIVHTPHDLLVVNDSKSTTPEAAALACAAVSEQTGVIRLIVGGYDKQVPLDPFSTLPGDPVLYPIGTTGRSIAESVSRPFYETLDAAVAAAIAESSAGDTLLLSPGCASWDQFTNYQQRGEAFVGLVNEAPAIARSKDTPA